MKQRSGGRPRPAMAAVWGVALIAGFLILAGTAPARAGSAALAAPRAAGAEAGAPRIAAASPAAAPTAAPPDGDRCARCHVPPTAYHYGRRCGQCHSASRFLPPKAGRPPHPISLVGKHATLDCAACHAAGKALSLTCAACHAAPKDHLAGTCAACHTPEGWAQSVVWVKGPDAPHLLSAKDDCLVCHAPDERNWPAPASHESYTLGQCRLCHASTSKTSVTIRHKTGAGLLVGLHTKVDCIGCHPTGEFQATLHACVACHKAKDRHAGQFGTDCGRCHTPNGWAGAAFDHGETGFALVGAHGSAGCTSCHPNGKFKGTPRGCVACHQADDHHAGQFGTDCGRCHTPNGWAGATFDHGETGFALVGAHLSTACTRCHVNGQYGGTPRECVACHLADDHHGGQFGTDCGRCHTPNGWAGATFDHDETGFVLVGAHLNTACTQCHVNGQYGGTPRECVACHQADDHHGGQFGTDCGRCHTPNGWDQVTFDHNQTAFPLTGAHLGVSCTSCHPNGQFDGTPTECSACHGEPDYHAGMLGTQCADCHQTSGWLPATYNRPHTFPRNHHGAPGCRTCHPGSLGGYTCYGCHDAGQIAEIHIEHGIPDFSNCMACHPNGGD